MTTQPSIQPEPIDPAWALPDVEGPGNTVTAPCFARLLAAARVHGWPGVWRVWAEGYVTYEPTPSTGEPRPRPARRKTLRNFLNRRSDLHALLEDAANQRRDRLLNALENEAEKIALSEGDVTLDFGKNGQVTRKRVDRRNKLRAIETLLKAHDPDLYGDRKRVEVDGKVDHRHAHAHLIGTASDNSGYRVSYEALATLPPDEQRQLLMLLEKVEQARLEQSRERIAAQHQPAALPGRTANGEAIHE